MMMFKKNILFVIVLCVFVNASVFSQRKLVKQQGEVSLFDGKTLKGWKQIVGKAIYKVEDGAIAGISVIDSANSFLVSEKQYGDFILELDVKIESPLSNSGVQTRSHFGGPLHPNKVYGRQVEIDPSARAWTGGIYDEDRREWLYPLDKNPAAKKAFTVGQYNHFKIECIGNTTKTWINQVPVACVIDTLDSKGFIALQVHAVKTQEEAAHKVYFKNIKIQTAGLVTTPFPPDVTVVNLTGAKK